MHLIYINKVFVFRIFFVYQMLGLFSCSSRIKLVLQVVITGLGSRNFKNFREIFWHTTYISLRWAWSSICISFVIKKKIYSERSSHYHLRTMSYKPWKTNLTIFWYFILQLYNLQLYVGWSIMFPFWTGPP